MIKATLTTAPVGPDTIPFQEAKKETGIYRSVPTNNYFVVVHNMAGDNVLLGINEKSGELFPINPDYQGHVIRVVDRIIIKLIGNHI